MALLWLGGCTQVWAVPALQEVKVNPLLADQLLLELSFSEPVSGFTDRLTYEPNQLLLHVPGAIGALTVNPLPIKQQGVNNLLVEGKGQGLDIKIALDQLTPYQVHQQGNKLLVALGDMPFVAPATLARLVGCATDDSVIAAPRHAGERGHPVLFGRAHFDALTRLDGDRGAAALLREHPVRWVDVDDPGIVKDIDRPSDLSG